VTVDRFARLQAARDIRLARLQRGSWCVVKVNDDGTEYVVERDLRELVASKIAGQKRDTMSGDDIDRGWNYVSLSQSRLTSKRIKITPKVDAVSSEANLQTEPAANQEATHRT